MHFCLDDIISCHLLARDFDEVSERVGASVAIVIAMATAVANEGFAKGKTRWNQIAIARECW